MQETNERLDRLEVKLDQMLENQAVILRFAASLTQPPRPETLAALRRAIKRDDEAKG